MHRKQVLRIILGIMAIMALTLILGSSAGAADYKTLHKFKQMGVRGSRAAGGLTFDAAGNLYGVTQFGGTHGWGTVFELTPNGDGSWVESVLHSFIGSDGEYPNGGLTFDAAGNLYRTTWNGGAFSYGTVFELTPKGDGSWRARVLHSFNLPTDGADPDSGVIFDAAGNLYGTTPVGGAFGNGAVFELTPNGDGSWGESVLHSFNDNDGYVARSGVIFDTAGNLYGTTARGGVHDLGTVFELTPSGDESWVYSLLHSFNPTDGGGPVGGLTFDAAGNLYGTTWVGGAFGYGTVFELTPNGDGSWVESVLHSFNYSDGGYPGGLTFDAAGDLYGTAGGGAYDYGVVFRLRTTPAGAWRYRVFHSFKNHPGALPRAGLVLDQAGNLFGTTYGDGSTTFGSVFEITP